MYWFLLFLFLVFLAPSWALDLPQGTRRVVFYDAKGNPIEAREDEDADGFFETVFYFKEGRLTKKIKLRRDKSPRELLEYDAAGRPKRLSLDRNGDGKFDKWQRYESGRLVSVIEDRNFDGRPDLKAKMGSQGGPEKILLDDDYDGCFEIEEIRTPEGKEILIKKFYSVKDCKGRVYARVFYQGTIPLERHLDLDQDGRFETKEFYQKGKLCLVIKEKDSKEAFLYQNGQVKEGFRDLSVDGLFEEKYDFVKKRWYRLRSPLSLEELIGRCR